MVVKANAITVNKTEYEDMCKALVAETKECERLKELNREMARLLKIWQARLRGEKDYSWGPVESAIAGAINKAEEVQGE